MFCLASFHGAAIGSLLTLDVTWTLKLLLAGGVTLSAWFSIRRYAWLSDAASIRDLSFTADGMVHCRLGVRATESFTCAISPHSTALPWLAVILLKSPHRWRLRPVVVLPDALSEDDFRALRIWLRWKADTVDKVGSNDA